MNMLVKHLYLDVGVNYFSKNTTKISPYLFYNTFIKKGGEKKYRYKSYDFIVKEDYNENDNKIIIFIGKKVKCLLGILDYNKNLKNTSRTIILQSFGYYNSCSEGKSLRRGNGIMYSFINYIKDNYKNVRNIILTDNAVYECNNEINIKMSVLYFFKYGDYYYSKKYGFKLYDEDKYKLRQIKKMFKESLNHYWNNQNIDTVFLEKFDNTFDMIEGNEWSKIREKLIKYKFISLFFRKYKFISCLVFSQFIEFIREYYKISNDILYNKTFILKI